MSTRCFCTKCWIQFSQKSASLNNFPSLKAQKCLRTVTYRQITTIYGNITPINWPLFRHFVHRKIQHSMVDDNMAIVYIGDREFREEFEKTTAWNLRHFQYVFILVTGHSQAAPEVNIGVGQRRRAPKMWSKLGGSGGMPPPGKFFL